MEHSVIRCTYEDKELILIPTAHVSKDSYEFAKKVLEEEQPDSICIELDENRYQSVKNKKKWEETDIVQIIKKNQVGYLLVNLVLGSYQRKMAKHLDSRSGAEMMEGIRVAEERNIPLVLADRSIQTTFTRIWRSQTLWDKMKLLFMIVSTIFDEEEISEEEILNLQKEDMLSAALKELQKSFPKITEILVHERDMYLAYKIKHAPGKKVCAILGAAHCIGIQEEFKKDYAIEPLDELPPKGKLGTILLWGIPAVLVILVLATFRVNVDLGWSQIKYWILLNGVLSAVGATLCLAHPLTILIAFVAAPITSLSPMLAAGWFAGITEAMVRKPQVKDFENMAEDIATLKGIWHNKCIKVLLVVVLANVGSTIGTFLGGMDIVRKFIEAVF